MSMYGSIHTHFESQYDTGNDKKEMIKNFISNGAKRVAVTEHGVFSSYEDLKDIVFEIKAEAKKNGEVIPDFDVIPGIEGYFGEHAAHIILIAKDYEGYLSLCKIISESNKNIIKGKPIITEGNLIKNVQKGHVLCTSACIAGPFGRLLGLEEINLKKKIDKLDEELETSNYRKNAAFVEEYENKKKEAKNINPTKKEIADAERIAKKTGNDTLLMQIREREALASEMMEWLSEKEFFYNEAESELKKLGKAKFARKQANYEKYEEELAEINRKTESGIREMEAHFLLDTFINIFGANNFFFEIQNHRLEEEREIYNNIISFAYRAEHPYFIASNDIHIGVTKEDPKYEEMLKRRNVIKFTRFNTYQEETEDDKEYTIKNDEELKEELLKIVKDIETVDGVVSASTIVDQAIKNIENSLKDCEIKFPQNENHYPKFCDDENAEFEKKVREGLKIKFPNGFPKGKEKEYEDRVNYELGIIKEMGYAGYHLIVADYLAYGRLLGYLPTEEEIENAPLSIPELDAYITNKEYPRIGYNIGPGRGSAVGSICCYAMGITDIDPIPYGLLFERFLNVERVSMPDIDSDFRTDIRAKVIDYCRAKYGAECICQIMTKSYGSTKGNLRLAARYLGSKYFEDIHGSVNTDIFTETEDRFKEILEQLKVTEEDKENGILIEETNPDLKTYLKDWYNRADKLSKLYDELGGNLPDNSNLTPEEVEIIQLAEILDGVFTGYGQHAAGTIISGDDLTGIIPLMWNDKKGSMETQCTMAQAEAKGLLKMDFLGLKNLDIITNIIRHPTKKSDMDGRLQNYIERDRLLKDPAIFRDIFWTGLTQGVFQFESPGMKKMLMEFKPESFEDIILLVAAYRPGPIDYIPEIIASKWHNVDPSKYPAPKKSISLKNDTLESILSPTYGCPIYQEQIMQIFQHMAGYSLGGADIVRRYMSKKKEEPLKKEKQAFIYGDAERGIPGCMALQGLTEKEADDLFEQMMPFAKYGFNKSHATAYAMVAMFTAYLKKYHTADFFRYSLDATANLSEIPDFVKEMPYFGLELKAPSMQNSRNYFSVEDDGKVIRYGLRYVKGFSEQNVQRYSTMQEFIEMNPDVSLKIVEKYAQLGMFKECWKMDKKTGRVQGNRHECLRWLETNGELLKKYRERVEKTDELSSLKAELETKLSFVTNAEEEELLKKELNRISNQLSQWTDKRKELAKQLNDNRTADNSKGYVSKETTEETLENRQWEIELLSLPFDIKDSLQLVKQSKNKADFALLKRTVEENNGSNKVKIPAVVLSVSAEKKAKKSGNVYYDVTLMDKNKNIVVRRFNKKPDVLEGEFILTIDDCKYFNCNAEACRPIVTSQPQNKSYVSPTAEPKEKVNALIFGGQVEAISTAGRRTTYVVTNAEHNEIDERE